MAVQIKNDGSASNFIPTENLDNQLTDILSNPRLNANEREGKVKEEFAKLTENEAKELYQQLTSKDHPLSQQFHTQFTPAAAKDLTNALKAKFESRTDAIQEFPESKQTAPGVQRFQKNEKVMERKAQEIQLRDQLMKAGDPKMMKQVKQIVQDPGMSLEKKKAEIQKLLQNATPDEFKSFLAYSRGWTKEDGSVLTGAIAGSDALLKRIGKELSKQDQLDAFERIRDDENISGADKRMAISAILREVTPTSLNYIAKKDTAMMGILMARTTFGLQQRFGELELPLQKNILPAVAKLAINDNTIGNMLSSMTPKAQANLIQALSPGEKNQLIDSLQNNGVVPNFLESLKLEDLDAVLLNGLTQKNAAFISRAYAHLEKYAPTADLKKKYAENVLHVDGWIENHFPTK